MNEIKVASFISSQLSVIFVATHKVTNFASVKITKLKNTFCSKDWPNLKLTDNLETEQQKISLKSFSTFFYDAAFHQSNKFKP